MGNPFYIEITGVKEAVTNLEDFGKFSGKAIMNALAQAGLSIQSAAKLRLKQRGHYVTGRLASSIHSEVKEGALDKNNKKVTGMIFDYKAEQSGESFDGTLSQHAGNLELLVGTNVEYALRIELGFRGEDKLGRKYHQAGDPFMRFAAELGGKKLPEYVRKQIERLVLEANQRRSNDMYKKWAKQGVFDYEASMV